VAGVAGAAAASAAIGVVALIGFGLLVNPALVWVAMVAGVAAALALGRAAVA
jgi:uncharacterized membrane protein YkgB